ncbi:hypothetical protein F5887DRAFT_1193778, partial [Amanita rubescens]
YHSFTAQPPVTKVTNAAPIWSAIINWQPPLFQCFIPFLLDRDSFSNTTSPIPHIKSLAMYHQPQELDRDHDSSDPLNPTVNYTHFHPSPEQQDPRIPLGFKIYGIGCLAAFLTFLLLSVIFVIFKKQIKRFWNSRKENRGQKKLGDLGKPSSHKSLESGGEVNGRLEKSSFSGDHTALCPPPTCTSSSYEGESAHWRGKPREIGSWDSCVTMVNAGSPHLDPSSYAANADGGIPSTYSPIFTSNAYTPTPQTTLMPSRLPQLDPPVSPKTIPAPPYYIFPVEPVKAVTTDGVHRTTQAARQTSPLKSNNSAGEERSDISRNERQNRSSTASGRSSASSSRKGILKTSPTYVARTSSQSPPYRLLSSDGDLASTFAKEGLNGVFQSSSSASPLRGSITPQSASSDGASISNSERRRRSGETKRARFSHHCSCFSFIQSGVTHCQLGPRPKLSLLWIIWSNSEKGYDFYSFKK